MPTLDELCASPILAFPQPEWKTTYPSERVARLKERLPQVEREIDVERARLTTQSYRASEGQPTPVRRARMLLHLARHTHIAIHPGELIVGNRSLLPRMGVIAPEGAVDWVDRELEVLPTRPQDQFQVRPEQIHELRTVIFPYWQGHTLEDTVAARIPAEVRAAVQGKVFSLNQTDHAQGHILPDVEAWLHLGVKGLRDKVAAARCQPEVQSPEQQVFYDAALLALQAAQEFMARYGALARASLASPPLASPPRSGGYRDGLPTHGGHADGLASPPLRGGYRDGLPTHGGHADGLASPPSSGGYRDGLPTRGGHDDSLASPPRSGGCRDGLPTHGEHDDGLASPPRSGGCRDGVPTDPAEDLAHIAATCDWLSENPPRNFQEALQALWFLFVLLQMESNASSFSPGRLDQYLWPYLERDLASGRLTLPQAQELLEHLWLKFNEIVLLRSSAGARYFAGFPIGFNVIVGGQLPDGSDATNPLSCMALRAQADLGLTQPNLSIRIHRGSPQEFLLAAAFVISKGSGMPQVFNDEVIIPGQLNRSIAPRDAFNYAVVGCVELSTPGKALGWSDAAMFNMTRLLELTLFGGQDPQTGAQIGLPTPRLDQVRSFDELEAAYDAQLAHFVALMVQSCNVVDRIHAEVLPSPFLSLVIDDCIERGLDVTAGGAHYNFSGVQGVQVANVADSLAAVRQAVFDERWLSAGELLAALRANYEGGEPLRQRLVHHVPKYGNDDDAVDALAQKWAGRYSALVAQHANVRGGTYQPGFYTVSAHVPMGAHVGATPDGRLAGQPLADGGLSPMAGQDRHGPTAVLRSVSKINLSLASNGTLLNLKFLPAFFDGDEALFKFVTLLRAFCTLMIPHVQFNVVSAATLRQAQADPAQYRHLVVRVAGYSAYFTELDRALQKEIIRRTEFATIP